MWIKSAFTCRPTGTSPTDTPGRMQRKTAESTAPTSVVSSLLPSRSSSTVCLTGDFDLFSHNLLKEKGDNQDKWHKLNPTLLGKKILKQNKVLISYITNKGREIEAWGIKTIKGRVWKKKQEEKAASHKKHDSQIRLYGKEGEGGGAMLSDT